MKTVSANLQTHLGGELTSLATCWKITRRDGAVLGFTEHDQDIEYDSVTYQAGSGFNASAVKGRDDLAVDALELLGLLDDEAITEADILAGKYDYAEVSLFLMNAESPEDGVMNLRTGWIGEVQTGEGHFTAELRGLMQKLDTTIGRLFTPGCDAELGDGRCGVNLAAHTVTGTVTAVTSRTVFADSARSETAGLFNHGQIIFTGGANDGLSMEVKYFNNGELTLMLPMPYDVEVGDGYSLIGGCDKTLTTCRQRFNNISNFRGFPHVPGTDAMLKTAGTR